MCGPRVDVDVVGELLAEDEPVALSPRCRRMHGEPPSRPFGAQSLPLGPRPLPSLRTRTAASTLLLASLAGFMGLPSPARAAEVTRVASSFEEGDMFDLHLGVAYSYNFKRAAILREWNAGEIADDETRLVRDLIYQRQRHTLTTSLEVGLWHDLALYVELPIVLHDTRSYTFDQRTDGCVFGDAPAYEATCVNKDNSTVLRDELIPRGGIDATSDTPFAEFSDPNAATIFRGPVRRGIDQMHVGLKYAVLNQATRPHLPTWVLAFEGRFGVGRPMTFSRDIANASGGNSRVGRRVHELGLWTALSHRHRFLEPYFTAFWRQSIRGAGSLFRDYDDAQPGDPQTKVSPQSSAGLTIGTEIIPWERKAKNLKVALQFSGSAILHYGGRGYSEIWELLADSPALAGSYDPTTQGVSGGMPVSDDYCDRDAALDFARVNPGSPSYLAAGGASCRKFDGITDIQDYGTFGFNSALDFQLGQYVRLMLGVNAQTDTRHFITGAGRGDADADPQGDDPSRVESGTVEVNPVRRDIIDNVGRRFAVGDVLDVYGYARVLLTF